MFTIYFFGKNASFFNEKIMTTRKTDGLHQPYKGVLFASA
jgi:hypothetical protein